MITAFTASPSPVNPGDPVTLSWSVSGATSLAIDQGVGPVTGVSTVVHPALTTTYTLTAEPGGVTAQATAVVNVVVTVSPDTASLLAEQTQQFTATVAGATNTAVTWDVQEGSAGGSVEATGLYTAPMASGTFHVRATSQADGTAQGVATVTVIPPPPGTLDVSFGDGGLLTLRPNGGSCNSHECATALAITDGGQIIIAGKSSGIVAISLDSDGAPSPGFNLVTSGASGPVSKIFVLGDGSLAILAFDLSNSPFIEKRIQTGEIDSSFGDGGYAKSTLKTDTFDVGGTLDRLNNFILSGYQIKLGSSSTHYGSVQAFNSNGQSLYLTAQPVAPITSDQSIQELAAVALPDGGSITLGAGGITNGTATFQAFEIDSTGTLTRITNGSTASTTNFKFGASILTPQNELVAVSSSSKAIKYRLSNHTFDINFQNNYQAALGIVNHFDRANAIARQSDGKFVIAFSNDSGSPSDKFTVGRFNADGTIDTTFGNSGLFQIDSGDIDFAEAIAIDSRGRIVVVGGSGSQWAVMRLMP